MADPFFIIPRRLTNTWIGEILGGDQFLGRYSVWLWLGKRWFLRRDSAEL